MKVVRNTVTVNAGIHRQFVDKPVHIIGFIIDGFNILIHFFRGIRHTVHNAFHIALYGGNRSFQIVRDIADQLTVLLLMLQLLLRGFFQPQAHVLIVPVQITDLSLGIGLQGILEITLLDPAHGHIQIFDRTENTGVYPSCQHQTGEHQNHQNCNKHIHQQMFGYQGIRLSHYKSAALTSVRKQKVYLFYKFVKLVIIQSRVHG